MEYKSIEPFVKQYGVHKTFFVDYFMKQEKEGKSKNEIQADAIRNEIVKSPLMLNRTYKFYEIVKDEIGLIK